MHHWFYREHGKMTLIDAKVTCTMCKALRKQAQEQDMSSNHVIIHLKSQILGAQGEYQSYTDVPALVNCSWCRSARNDRVPTHFGKVFPRQNLQELTEKGYEFGVTYCRVTCLVCRYLFLTQHRKEARVTIQEQFRVLVNMFSRVENITHALHRDGRVMPLAAVDMLCEAIHLKPEGKALLDALIAQSVMVKKTEDGMALTAVFEVPEAENPDGTSLVEGA